MKLRRHQLNDITEAVKAAVTIDADELIRIVRDYCDPGDVFHRNVLADWAESNGYVKAE